MKYQTVSNEGLDHVKESAAIVKEAILSFPTEELHKLQTDSMEPMNTAENFMDVWYLERNADRRPAFLQALASDEVLDALTSYLKPDPETKADRPAYLLRVSLGILNRMFKEGSVGEKIAESRLEGVLEAVSQMMSSSHHPNNKLMCLESVSVLIKHAKDKPRLENCMEKSGFLQESILCIATPSSYVEALKDEKTEETEAEISTYAEICGMMAAQLLVNLCFGKGSSEAFVERTGGKLLQNVIHVMISTGDWSQKHVLRSYVAHLYKLMLKLPETYPKELEGKNEQMSQCLEKCCGRGWTVAAKILKLMNVEKEGVLCCGNCGKQNEKLQVCGGCHVISYCSRECQKEHYKVHKNECMKI